MSGWNRVSGYCSVLLHSNVVYGHPDEELDNVLHRLLDSDLEDLPIVDDDRKLCGLVNLTEILAAAQQGKFDGD